MLHIAKILLTLIDNDDIELYFSKKIEQKASRIKNKINFIRLFFRIFNYIFVSVLIILSKYSGIGASNSTHLLVVGCINPKI